MNIDKNKEPVTLGKLPKQLMDKVEFTTLFSLKPEVRSRVLIFNKETQQHEEKRIFRAYQSYLNTPEFDKNNKKSYMFLNKSEAVPKEFLPFLEFAKTLDRRYNQMVVNWYEPKDYIEFHRDCTANFISADAPILCINLNESDSPYHVRSVLLKDVASEKLSSVPLANNTYYILNNNDAVRHAVPAGSERRISITFRMVKEKYE